MIDWRPKGFQSFKVVEQCWIEFYIGIKSGSGSLQSFFKVVKGPPWAGRDSSIKNEVHSVRIFLEWFWYIPTYFLVPKVMMGPKPIQSSIFSFIHVRFKIAKLDNKFIKCRFDFIKTLTALCKKGSYWIVKIGYKKLMETF